ncbi:MAG: N-6 DNA methylase [Patescibacteria group bacterium]
MYDHKINDSIRKTIKSAFTQIGYTDAMISSDVHFVGKAGNPFFADLVAYSGSLRKDTDTAVISVKGIDNTARVEHDKDIAPFLALATPIIILAEYKKTPHTDAPRLLITGLNKTDVATGGKVGGNVIPLSRFEEYLKAHREQFTPRRLERAKWYAEQLTLFDVYPNLIGEAYQIAINELVHTFERGVRNILEENPKEYRRNIIQAAIAILAARILRDRRRKQWPTSSGVIHFLEYAKEYLPGYFEISNSIAKRLDPLLIKYLNDTLDFSQVSIDIVGKFYESAFVTKETRDQWGIHYTPSLLAKTLLRRMPIEEIPPAKRILADPTCGSGSLLAAGYERLTEASYRRLSDAERHQTLINSIFGNDKDQFAAEIARMTLMLFHPPHKNNWKINNLDAEGNSFKSKWINQIGSTPTIIVANPPFGEKGGGTQHPDVRRGRNQPDRSALILKQCLDILPDGGLLGIILTETVLDQQLVKPVRDQILRNCQILEQWSIPVGWFQNVKRPAMAWIIRKTVPSLKTIHIVSLADVPVIGRKVQFQGTIDIDLQKLPDNLVPSPFHNILMKIARFPICVNDFYSVHNGLQPISGSVKTKKTEDAHPWSGVNIRGTDPFSDFSDGHEGWLELKDNNFPQRSQRKDLRKHLTQNEPMLMLRANRNAPWKYKWSAVAMIDFPRDSSRVVAPAENFHVAFSKDSNIIDKKNYIYALWALMNHPIASLWLHESLRVQKIPTKSFRKFPLPEKWGSKDDIKSLALHAKDLTVKIREILSQHIQQKAADIKEIIKTIDNIIFQMYEITNVERRRIEEWLEKEARPGLEDFYDIRKPKKTFSSVEPVGSGESIWETIFETLDIDFEKSLIKLAVDGLSHNSEESESDKNKILLKIIPAVPGWAMKKGALGWIELTTHYAEKLNQSPEQYIVSFRLHKNAYKTQEEIDKSLYIASDIKSKKAVS